MGRTYIRGAATVAALILVVAGDPAAAQFPEGTVAAFCEADGRGERLGRVRSEALDAPLWRFEPAWDRVFLISGYEVTLARVVSRDEADVVVRYSVIAEVNAEGARSEEREDMVRFTALREGERWRIAGPPAPPYLFASSFAREMLVSQLSPESADYLSNSAFVWQMLRRAGWTTPYRPASAFLDGIYFRPVAEPRPGDVVAYLRSGTPYHVGLYEGEDRLASATPAGVMRTTLNAFPGEIRYLRLTEAARAAETPAEPVETPAAAS